jgi:tetratricopeptide (TPR) repeat protein
MPRVPRAVSRVATLAVIAAACSAFVSCNRGRAFSRVATPTFNKDIAPIVWNHCTTCHRSGQLAPFALLTYDDVRQHADQIVRATKARIMPPWLAQADVGVFSNDRRLRLEEIASIERWVVEGAPEGDAADRGQPPRFTEGWQLGQPDLVLELPQPYMLRPGDTDVFRNFVLPIPLATMRYVRGIEVRPGNTHVVHHATIGIDRTRTSRLLDASDPEPGYEGMFSEGAHSPDNHALGWTPGMVPLLESPDMAWRLEPDSDLLVQLHMMPMHLSTAEAVPLSVGLFFTDTAPSRFPIDFKLGSKTIDIPAGNPAYVTEDIFELPVDVDVLSVYPHAHYLGKRLEAFARLPDGNTRSLLTITDWDFHWQDLYRFAVPLPLPRGTRLTMRYTYDNSPANAHNPHHPPTRVVYGPKSTDEMGDLWLRLLPHSAADSAVLATAFVQNELHKDTAVAERGVADHPADAGWHDLLATRYLAAGRIAEAIDHFATAIRLNPGDAEAHNNFAQALQRVGRADAAIEHYRMAARLAPGNDQVRLNLASALQDRGEVLEAIRQYQIAVTLNPNVAEARNNFGTALASADRLNEAIQEFRAALAIRPDYAEASHNLSAALALQSSRAR